MGKGRVPHAPPAWVDAFHAKSLSFTRIALGKFFLRDVMFDLDLPRAPSLRKARRSTCLLFAFEGITFSRRRRNQRFRQSIFCRMASKQEMAGLELKRITENIHHMNPISIPLVSLDENSCDDFHTELFKSNTAEGGSLLYSNKMRSDDMLVKTTITWKPDLKEEPDEFRFLRNTSVTQPRFLRNTSITQPSDNCFITQPSDKCLTTTTLHKKVTYGEKENLESGSGQARGPSQFSNSIGKAGCEDGKRLQEGFDVLSNSLTRLDGRSMDKSKASAQKVSAGPLTILEEGSVYSQEKQPGFRAEDSLCFAPDSSIQTSVIESRKGAKLHIALVQEKMKKTAQVPLLCQFRKRSDQKSLKLSERPGVSNPYSLSQLQSPLIGTQNFEEHACDVSRHCPMKAQKTGEHKFESVHDAQICKEIHSQKNDHFVVLFSEQKTLEASAGRKIRQELSKLSSLCTKYSLKILSWITSLATEQNMKECLRRIRQIFSSSPRGFVNLRSQKLPVFSTSLSSNRKLAKDKELKAVLMKINEVLASMERTSPNSMQERS